MEAAGEGLESGKHSASLQKGSAGVLHGNRTFILQDDNGQITETHSISAGLDYPGVGPGHAWLQEIGRAEYVGITDTVSYTHLDVYKRQGLYFQGPVYDAAWGLPQRTAAYDWLP